MANVDVIIKTIDKTSAGLSSSEKSIKNSTADMAKSFLSTAAAAAAITVAIGAAAKKVYEFGREGAQLELTEMRFGRLTESVGSLSDAMLGDLRRATRGLYSDAQLMGSATDFMALGLAKSHDEVVRLSSVAAALNMNMNQLVLTLTNKTTMRFDALGVAVDGFDEKVKSLEQSGLNTQDAFTEAFLQQAEEQIIKVGHAADSNAGSIMRMEASWANLTDTLKMQAAPALADVADSAAKTIDMYILQDEKLAELTEGMGFFGDASQELAAAQLYANGITRELNSDIDSATRSYMAWGNSIEETDDKMEASASSTERLAVSYAGILGIVQSLQGTTDSFNEKQEDITKKTDDVLSKIVELTDKGYSRWGEEIQSLLGDYDDLNAAMAENASKFEEETQKRILDRAKELLAADGLTVEEEKYLIQRGVAMGVFTQDVANQSMRIIEDAQTVASAFDNLDGRQVDIYINAHWNGFDQGNFLNGAVTSNSTLAPTSFAEANQRAGTNLDFMAQEVLRRMQ